MFALRRAAVRTLSFQPSRQLTTLRSGTRVTAFQPAKASLCRTFHQARIWRAEEDLKKDEASPVAASTSGETVTTEPSAAEQADKTETSAQADAVSESSGTTSEPLGQSEAESKPVTEQAYEKAEDVSEQATEKKEEISQQAQEQASTLKEKAEDVSEQAKDQASTITERATDAVSNVAQSMTEAGAAAAQQAQSAVNQASQAATNTASAFGTAASQERRPREPRPNPPSRILYVGNLFFEVTAPNLEAEFGRFGEVTNSRVVTDNRGLSKGFGYVEFATQESADQALRELDQKVFQGRRMAVQYHAPRTGADRRGGARATLNKEPALPSKTLFIGNMSYQMSDRDLNDLFRSIRNVLDVRVAIDRRSGQPRGFAHADFIDIDSAVKAKEVLEKKVVYGRTLKVDFSGNSNNSKREV